MPNQTPPLSAEADGISALQAVGVMLAGGVGGLLPTLVKLAPIYIEVPQTPWPSPGLYLGLSLFFLIGAVVALISKESDFRKAIFLGIAAPGMVTSFLAGKAEVATAPPPIASSAPAFDANAAVARLLGAGSAHAQVSMGAAKIDAESSKKSQLTVVPRVVGNARALTLDRVTLQFLAENGNVLATRDVNTRAATTVPVPEGAYEVRASSGGVATNTKLPVSAYSNADLKLSMNVSKGNDFLWALGVPRKGRVNSLDASVDNIQEVQFIAAANAPVAASRAGIEKGSKVINASGVQVGVVDSVQMNPGESATVVLRPKKGVEVRQGSTPPRSSEK